MADKLIVRDLGNLDGEYDFSLMDIIMVGQPGSLTNREAHRIKQISGIRAGELMEALIAGDNDALIALALVLFARAGKLVNEEKLWDAKMGSIDWDLEALRKPQEDDEGIPPAVPAATPETASPSRNGGESSETTSGQKASDPSRTGHQGSETSATFDQLTSVS